MLTAGIGYSRGGFRLCRAHPRLFVILPAIFCLPILGALGLLFVAPDAQWRIPAAFALTSLTVVGGHLTLVVAIDAIARGDRPPLPTVLRRSLSLVPRYLLTNAQTTVIFWTLMLPLTTIVGQVSSGRPQAVGVVLWSLVVVLGLTWHLQTLFAPYLAICAGLSPTRAVIEGVRLVRGQLGTAATTFVSAAAFAGLPSLAVVLALSAIAQHEGPAATARFDEALPYLVTGAIELIRPVLVAAVHGQYEDLRRAHPEPAPYPYLLRRFLPL